MPVREGDSTGSGRARAVVRPQPRLDSFVEEVSAALSLREYQEEALREGLSASADKNLMHYLVLPTGAGKSRLIVGLVACLLRAGFRILVVSKNWQLLKQTADEFATLLPNDAGLMRRIGGPNSCLRHLSEGRGGRVFLTTLQTWHRRRDCLPNAPRRGRLAVVWDEAHWGINSEIGDELRHRYLGKALMYGLTATPVAGVPVHLAFHMQFRELAGTILARPRLREVGTTARWEATLQREDFSPTSLRELGSHPERNRQVVDEVVRGKKDGEYRRVLIFACDIAHAETLHRLIGERGLLSRLVHSEQPREAQEEALRLFREGRISVLVNVAMLTEGFNVPEIDSVILARPTCSQRLLEQMIGRGARKAPGKESFFVVEFTDNLQRFQDRIARAGDFLSGAVTPLAIQSAAFRPLPRHRESPNPPRFEDLDIPSFGSLPIAIDQTFGVEIELTAPGGVPHQGRAWNDPAERIIRRLGDTAEAGVRPLTAWQDADSPERWKVVYDASAGWEVVSPVLCGAGGFKELQAVCDGLSALVAEYPHLLRVNHRTGLHVTLATHLNTQNRLSRFVRLVQRLEPGLFTLTGPSRLFPYLGSSSGYAEYEGNYYCKPLRRLGGVGPSQLHDLIENEGNRYHTVNLNHAHEDIQLLEVRLHSGTTEFRKVALWVALWMQIFNRSRYAWTGPEVSGGVFPGRNRSLASEEVDREDIVKLLAAEGIPLSAEFMRLLRERRLELREAWRNVVPLRVASWEQAGWYANAPDQAIGNGAG